MTDLLAQLDLTAFAFWACFGAVLLSAFVQRLSGQAFGIIAAPLIALVAPGYLPAGLLLLGIVVGLTSAGADFSALTRSEIVPGFVGRLLGAVLGALLAAKIVATDALSVVIGVVVLLAVGLSLVGLRIAIRPVSLVVAGVCAGIMGTLTAIGAPPMALLYQHEPAKRSRAMQNAFFFWGMCVSVGALWWQGLVELRHLLFAATLLPAVVIGLAVAMPLASATERRTIRPYALGLSVMAALALLVRTLG